MKIPLICYKNKTLSIKKNLENLILITEIKLNLSRVISIKSASNYNIYQICYNLFYINFYNPKNQKLLLLNYWKSLISKSKVQKKKKTIHFNNFYEYKNINFNHDLIGTFVKTNFLLNQLINIKGRSVGKGFAGKIKRYGLKRGPMSHGSKHHRRLGSIGSGLNRVLKNKRMPGHLGYNVIQIENLKIMGFDKKRSLLYIQGSLPGKVSNQLSLTY